MNQHNPKVSIIVPVYNEENYINKCLQSIIDQTYQNIEIICVDDGSTDKSVNIINGFINKDKRIKLYHQNRSYAGIARNNGFSKATGEYVMFLDSDDYFFDELIEKMVKQISNTKSDIVLCCAYGRNEINGNFFKMARPADTLSGFPNMEVFSSDDVSENLFQLSVTWAWDKMYNVNFLRENNIHFGNTQAVNDLSFVCLANAMAKRITTIDDFLICHRINIPTSLYSSKIIRWRCLFDAMSNLKLELENKNIFEKFKKSFVNLLIDNMVNYALLRISDYDTFNEFYQYVTNVLIEEYELESYQEDDFHNKFSFSVLQKLLSAKKEEFLIFCINALNDLNSKSIGIANQKKWMLPIEIIKKFNNFIIIGNCDIFFDYMCQIKTYDNQKKVKWCNSDFTLNKNNNINCTFDEFEDVSVDAIIITSNDSILASKLYSKAKKTYKNQVAIFCTCDFNSQKWLCDL